MLKIEADILVLSSSRTSSSRKSNTYISTCYVPLKTFPIMFHPIAVSLSSSFLFLRPMPRVPVSLSAQRVATYPRGDGRHDRPRENYEEKTAQRHRRLGSVDRLRWTGGAGLSTLALASPQVHQSANNISRTKVRLVEIQTGREEWGIYKTQKKCLLNLILVITSPVIADNYTVREICRLRT